VLAQGATFAAYEVRRRIAVGGMGEVYLCRHRVLDRLDAVKVLRPHLATDADFRRRFPREALSTARLRHPNVVTVYTADEADGLLYLAMEYVQGEDLAALLDRVGVSAGTAGGGRLDPPRAVRLLRVVADALDAAHRAQLVHRDIKPSNLLVTNVDTPTESVTLVDFGISRILDGDGEITRTGEVVGTIAYCSPEQLTSKAVVGGACDQYALACVAFECLTGQVPFPRPGQLAIMTAHLTAAPPSAASLRPELPTAVDAVLARAMAKDPRARYPSCSHFVGALQAALAPAAPVAPVAPGDHPDFAAPASLAARARSGHRDLLRPAGHVDTLVLRVGWSPPGTPILVPLAAGPLAVRGGTSAVAGSVRWLLAQAVTRHRPRDLCLVHVAEPTDDESWLWVNWVPHARPSTSPVTGPHVATVPEAAADLMMRLRSLVSARRAEDGGRWSTRVLGVLDGQLGVRPDDAGLAEAARYGVHLVYLLRTDEPVPVGMSTLDLSADGTSCRLTRVGAPPVDGVCDVVSGPYVRDLVDLLPDE